jgi:CPA2 family monovalent cation:H+ antiporter-2
MLVNPAYLLENLGAVLLLTFMIVVGKSLTTVLMGFLFSRPARTALVVAAGLSQIGEFSFILGQAGLSLGMLNADQYSLILAGALLSITLNPLMFRLIGPAEAWLKRFPRLWNALDRHGPAPAPVEAHLNQHVVVVGYGRVGRHIVDVLETLHVPRLVIETDVERVEALNRRGAPTLYGDAANSEVLTHAGLERARALVVTTPEDATNELIVAAAHDLAPTLPIIARAATEAGVTRLSELGAQDVIHPEMEGGLHIVRHLLLQLGFPLREVHQYTEAVRRDHYDLQVSTSDEHRLLDDLVNATNNIEVTWLSLPEGNPLAGQTLAEADLRARTGASVVAILRNRNLLANPKSLTTFQPGDRIGFIGEREQIEAVEAMLGGSE